MAHVRAPINRAAYAAAQALVASNAWQVDAEAGRIWSSRFAKPVGAVRKGRGYVYSAVRLRGKQFKVCLHRVIWESVHGPIPDRLEINHQNGVKHDNRLANLELTDSRGNIRHAFDTGLRLPTTGDINGMAKVSDEQVLEIRRLCSQRVRQSDIATHFGITQGEVSNIKRGVTWQHLPGCDRAKGKLTEEQVAGVVALLRAGLRQADIAARFGITQSAVSQIKRR